MPRPSSNSPIYLTHASSRPGRIRRKIFALTQPKRDQPVQWLFLGRDYLKMRAWENSLGEGFTRIPYGRELQGVGKKLRRAYLDWIAALGKKHSCLTWWSSRLAERNTQLYSLFHDLCYLHIAHSSAASQEGPLLIVAESKPLLYTLYLQPDLKERTCWIGRVFLPVVWATWMFRLAAVWMWYLLRGCLEIWDARKTSKGYPPLPLVSPKKRVLIHSCIDESYFGADGKAHDRYFTILPEELAKRGYDVVVIPWLFNLRRSQREAFLWFRQFPGRYLIPEDFYTLSDYIWAAGIVIRQIWVPTGRQVFNGKDITPLVRDAAWRGAAATDAARFVRYVRLIEKLKNMNFRMDVFIDRFENMITEKPQVIALRKHLPGVMTVGFQHYIAPHPLLLNMFTTPEEAMIAPHPDVIVCNSIFAAELFSKEGFPQGKLRIGPSLRYLHLMNGCPIGVKKGDAVLVVLPLHPALAAEMTQKLLEAFPAANGIRLLLKGHPMMTDQQLLSALGRETLPPHFVLAQGELADWIPKAKCAVVAGGTSGLEILLAGVPVVTIGRETDFDIDPMGWFPELERRVYSPSEMRESVIRLLSLPNGDSFVTRSWLEQHRNRCLSAVSDETVGAFVEPVG